MTSIGTSKHFRLKLKIILLIILAIFLINSARANSFGDNCTLKKEIKGQKLYGCHFPWTDKELLILDIYGEVKDTAYYHGLLLKDEIEDGILAGIKQERYRSLVTLDANEQKQFTQLSKCVLSSYKSSVSYDYNKMVSNLAKGLKDAGSSYSKKDLMEANFMVDLSIWFDTTTRKMEIDPRRTKRNLMLTCGPQIVMSNIGTFIKKMAKRFAKFKFGCTGVAASAAATSDHALVLGRNFDTGLLGFYEKHQLILIQNNPNGIRSVGLTTAGMHFAGGISGFNNFGLTASLHQLQSENTKISYTEQTSETTPYLLHYVLNNARTLDDAINMIKETKGFGAWTIFIGDSKTDEIASIEMAGDKVVVARKSKAQYLPQSNHYFSPEMQKSGYEYSLGKTLESRARFSLVDRSLKNSFGTIDAQWVITMLSGHFDDLVGRRSFGRTTTKVYTAATHVMIPSRQELWMSFGDKYPTNQSPFVGFRIQGDNSIEFLGSKEAKREVGLDSWYASQGEYVKAYMDNEDNFRSIEQVEKSINHLNNAIELAKNDGITEFPYYLMRVRMELYKGALLYTQNQVADSLLEYQKAEDDLMFLQENINSKSITTHHYENALVLYWLAKVQDLKTEAGENASRELFAQDAKLIFDSLLPNYPGHHDFNKLIHSLDEKVNAQDLLSDPTHFGTVE